MGVLLPLTPMPQRILSCEVVFSSQMVDEDTTAASLVLSIMEDREEHSWG